MTTRIRIGLMPGGLDGLFLASRARDRQYNFFFLIPEGKEEERWARSFLPAHQCIAYRLNRRSQSMAHLNFEGVALHSNVAKLLHDNSITHLLIHHEVTPALNRWARQHHLTLVAADPALAQKLEHKIWFDRFLEKNAIAKPLSQITRLELPMLTLNGPLVIQESQSRGGEGTYFLPNRSAILQWIRRHILVRNKKYLVRQYIKGTSYGITLLIDNNQSVLSGVRRQCYGSTDGGIKKVFLGIQWVPSNFLSRQAVHNLEKIMNELGEALFNLGFRGYANVDFMVNHRDDVFVIECNPRMAASTTQLLAFAQTTGLQQTALMYMRSLLSLSHNNKYQPTHFPKSTFNGATIYIKARTAERSMAISAYYQSGVYQMKGDTVRFITSDITKVEEYPDSFIFYSDVSVGERVRNNTIIASILSSFPLYTDRGTVNKIGKLLLKYFSYV